MIVNCKQKCGFIMNKFNSLRQIDDVRDFAGYTIKHLLLSLFKFRLGNRMKT
jgi:hypothetical protein